MAAEPAQTHSDAELARLYDLDTADESADIDLYLALARASDGAILELAAGSGRICLPLARAGHAVTGVDRDADMLARARAAWAADRGDGALELIEADITTLELGRRFGLVILGLNSLLMLPSRDSQLAALQAMARHLTSGGRAVVDVVLPSPEDLALYDGRLQLAWQRLDESGARVAKLWAARYEPAAAIARIETLFDIWPRDGGPLRRASRSDEMHLLGVHELLALVERAGLRVETVGGDHEMGPFVPDSPRIVLVSGLI